MAIFAWIIGMVLLTQWFGDWEEAQYNPNQSPEHSYSGQQNIVTLQQNRLGHYLANGQVNEKKATFMIDTGATNVSIPYAMAEFYNLKPGAERSSLTANGIVSVYKTTIDTLSIGNIKLHNVRASLNPGMDRTQPILLGMSVLKQLELVQSQDELQLKQRLR